MRRQKEYANLDLNNLNYKNIIDYDGTTLDDYIITDDAHVYHLEEDGRYTVINPYLNTTSDNSKYNWKNGYYKIRINKRLYNLHWLLCRAFVPGYKCGLVADHIDNNSTHNTAENMQWLTKSENTKKFWNSLNKEELNKFKTNFSNAVKEAHKKGNYKEHLSKLHNKGDLK